MSLCSGTKQATNVDGLPLVTVRATFATRHPETGRLKSHLVTIPNKLRSEVPNVEAEFFKRLDKFERRGCLYTWSVSVVPTLVYRVGA